MMIHHICTACTIYIMHVLFGDCGRDVRLFNFYLFYSMFATWVVGFLYSPTRSLFLLFGWTIHEYVLPDCPN